MPTLYFLGRLRRYRRKEVVIIAVKVGHIILKLDVLRESNANRVTNVAILRNATHPRSHQVKLEILTKEDGSVDVVISRQSQNNVSKNIEPE